MRKNIFRGKAIKNSFLLKPENGWVYGVPVPICINCHMTEEVEIVKCHEYDELDNYALLSYDEQVDPKTVGQFTGLNDATKWENLSEKEQSDFLRNHKREEWEGKRIFEGDIVRYKTFDDFECYSVVKFGEYKQDGSGGEYNPTNCVGWYVEVDSFTCPDWAEVDPTWFRDCLKQQNLLEVNQCCDVIGNIHDNPELLEGGDKSDK